MSSILKNISLSIFTFISRIVSGSVVYIVLARFMDLNDFGLLTFGTTLAGLLTVTSEFGFSLMAQRDIPQNRFNFQSYVNNVLIQKGGFTLLSLLGGGIYLLSFYSGLNVKVGLIFAVNAVVTSYSMYFFAVFRAKNMFKIESYLSLFYSVVLGVIVSLYYVFDLDVIFVAYGLLVARLLQLIILAVIFIISFKPKLKFDTIIQKYLFKHSFSFGAHYIIGIFYFTIDNQLIAYYCGNESLAIYQSIFRILLILLSVNALIEGVFLPYLSKRIKSNSKEFIHLATLINKMVVFIGLLIFIGFNFFADHIVSIIYGDKYLVSLSIVLPLSIVLVIRSFTSMYSLLLTISDNQKMRVYSVLITLLVNVLLNLVFIPKFNFVGAAYVSLVTHVVLVILYTGFAYKVFKNAFLDKKTLLFSLLTIAGVVLKSYYDIQLNVYFSGVFIIFWLFALLLIFGKNQIFELRKLVTKNYV